VADDTWTELDRLVEEHRRIVSERLRHQDAKLAIAATARAQCESVLMSTVEPVLKDFARRLAEKGFSATTKYTSKPTVELEISRGAVSMDPMLLGRIWFRCSGDRVEIGQESSAAASGVEAGWSISEVTTDLVRQRILKFVEELLETR
jgi:hypothetical protein